MKVALFTAALLLGGLAFGQQPLSKTTRSVSPRTELTPDQKALNLTNKMITDLGLSGEQTSQISEVNLGIATKNHNARTNASFTAETINQIIQGNSEARKSMYKNILTTEQYSLFESLESTNAAYQISAL
jgi:hypothetical protein